ncbi:hypothetical protein [Mangrovicoccus sp. HB161399]|uniref:hypothetical protein n=1 Tax=Mangrovicoccus sp. HB161399 TaxID=2720392 RepID=UPI001553607A|nr:hypothetical protein [Mangrovicoccus sp. HB161399]
MRKLLCAAAMVAAPAFAHSSTLLNGVEVTEAFVLSAPDDTASFSYETGGQSFKLSGISVAGTDAHDGDSLSLVLYGLDSASTPFSTVIDLSPDSPSAALAYSSIADFVISSDFTVEFSMTGAPANAGITFSFTPQAVPVPMAGALLGTALLGGGAFAVRRKAS